eukprot:6172840-Pleurochrysis_carterae.AAC.1
MRMREGGQVARKSRATRPRWPPDRTATLTPSPPNLPRRSCTLPRNPQAGPAATLSARQLLTCSSTGLSPRFARRRLHSSAASLVHRPPPSQMPPRAPLECYLSPPLSLDHALKRLESQSLVSETMQRGGGGEREGGGGEETEQTGVRPRRCRFARSSVSFSSALREDGSRARSDCRSQST